MANPRRVEMLQRQILRCVANTVQFDLHDPRVTSKITFTRVKLARDLSHAKIFYSVLGTDGDKATAEKLLTHASGRIRRELGDELSTRSVPEISFHFDPSIEGAMAIEETLRKLAIERGEDPDADPGSDFTDYDDREGDSRDATDGDEPGGAADDSGGDEAAEPDPDKPAEPGA